MSLTGSAHNHKDGDSLNTHASHQYSDTNRDMKSQCDCLRTSGPCIWWISTSSFLDEVSKRNVDDLLVVCMPTSHTHKRDFRCKNVVLQVNDENMLSLCKYKACKQITNKLSSILSNILGKKCGRGIGSTHA